MTFLATPDFSVIDADVFLKALGQAFFTLSLGMGAIMVYGAYLPRKTRSRSVPAGSWVWIH